MKNPVLVFERYVQKKTQSTLSKKHNIQKPKQASAKTENWNGSLLSKTWLRTKSEELKVKNGKCSVVKSKL